MSAHRERDLPGFWQCLGNLLFGVFFDLRAPLLPEDAASDWDRARRTRKVAASWFRWPSVAVVAVLIGFIVWGQPALAPLLAFVWVTLTNRLVWSNGARPMMWKAPEVSRLGFSALALAVAAPLVFTATALLGVTEVGVIIGRIAGAAAALFVLIDAPLTAREIRRMQAPATAETGDLEFVLGLLGMNKSDYKQGITDGSFRVWTEGTLMKAQLPPGTEKLIENRRAIEKTLATRHLSWEVALVDIASRLLVLEPLTEETAAKRAASEATGGLFETAFAASEGVEVEDLGIVWDDEPPLPRL